MGVIVEQRDGRSGTGREMEGVAEMRWKFGRAKILEGWFLKIFLHSD